MAAIEDSDRIMLANMLVSYELMSEEEQFKFMMSTFMLVSLASEIMELVVRQNAKTE